MIKILLFLIFIFFSLGQIGRVSFLNQQINFYLYELLMFFLLLFYFLKFNFSPFKKLLKNHRWILWGWGYLFFSFCFSFFKYLPFENLVSFLYFLRLFFYFVFFLYFYFYYQKKPKKEIVLGLLIFSFLTIVLSFIQFFLYPNLRNLAYLGWDVHQNRVFGLFFDTSIAASIYGLLFLFWIIIFYYKVDSNLQIIVIPDLIRNLYYCFINFIDSRLRQVQDCTWLRGNDIYKNQISRDSWNNKIINQNRLSILFLPPLFILLYFTYSRFVIFSFLATLFLFFLKQSSFKKFFFILLFFIFLLIFFPQKSGIGVNLNRIFSIESRIKENILGIKIGLKNPLFGIGYNRIKFFRQKENLIWKSDFNIHHGASSFQSTYITIFVSAGIIGLLFLGKIIIELLKFNHHFFYLIIFIGTASLADNLLLHPLVIFILGSMLTIFDKRQ